MSQQPTQMKTHNYLARKENEVTQELDVWIKRNCF